MINVHRFIYDQWSFMIIDHVDHTWSMVFIKPWSIIKLIFYIIKLKDLRIQKRWNRALPSKTKPQWRGCILCFFKQTNSVICNNRTQISRSYLTIFCNHACQGWLLEILFCGRDAGCLQHTRMQQVMVMVMVMVTITFMMTWLCNTSCMINSFFTAMINKYHAWSIAYHSMINRFHAWSTVFHGNDQCWSCMINSLS